VLIVFKVEPERIEDFINYLIDVEEWDEAAVQLVQVVNNEDFKSPTGKSKHDMWMLLCDVIAKHSEKLKSVDVDKITRGGLKKFSEDTGKLWTTLADYYIRQSHFDKVSNFL
jgi:pre-mRNA-splicing factor SYF1